MQQFHEDEDADMVNCQAQIKSVIGDKYDVVYPRLLQLVMADGAYCEGDFLNAYLSITLCFSAMCRHSDIIL